MVYSRPYSVTMPTYMIELAHGRGTVGDQRGPDGEEIHSRQDVVEERGHEGEHLVAPPPGVGIEPGAGDFRQNGAQVSQEVDHQAHHEIDHERQTGRQGHGDRQQDHHLAEAENEARACFRPCRPPRCRHRAGSRLASPGSTSELITDVTASGVGTGSARSYHCL